MRESAIAFYRCVTCGGDISLGLVHERSGDEIRSAVLKCDGCGAQFPVAAGIVHLTPDSAHLSGVKLREREGWIRIGREQVWSVDRDQTLLTLPEIDPAIDPSDHWREARMTFPAALALMEPLAGKRLLDVGASFCWSARKFAERGAEVIATDFNPDPELGLGKGDFFMRRGTPHFERLCADAEHLPLADSAFDLVFCCATIHHFERPQKLLTEIARVLRPGGRFIAINEAFRPLLRDEQAMLTNSAHTQLHLSHGINEQVFAHGDYRRFFTRAGLRFGAYHARWDVEWEGKEVRRVAHGAGLTRRDFAISDADKNSARRLAARVGIHRLLRIPPLAAVARTILFNYTGAFRILVGEKPAA